MDKEFVQFGKLIAHKANILSVMKQGSETHVIFREGKALTLRKEEDAAAVWGWAVSASEGVLTDESTGDE